MPAGHDDQLAAERSHLAASRHQLARMRDKVTGLAAQGGDPVSTAYLGAALWRRRQALEDDPDIPLFFGRLDYATPAETLHIGRRHVTDEAGDPLVVDWRAAVSRPFYRASPDQPMGIELRRRFGFARGTLTALEDEHLMAKPEGDGLPAGSAIMESEIERPRVGPMRDIVATIQPDQDELVRASLTASVCVQGSPGTGKTAVGLHRAAYLLYAHRERLRRQGVLVVGPNDSFLRYIADVLPALGEIDAHSVTVEQLSAAVQVRGIDRDDVARLKGAATMAKVVQRAVWQRLRAPSEALVVPRGSRRWRVPAYEVENIVAELRGRGVRYGAGRSMLAQRLANAVLVKMEAAGDSPDDRVQDTVARSRPVRDYVEAVWPKLAPARVVFSLLADPAFRRGAAAGVLTSAEQQLLCWPQPPATPAQARWSLADAVLVDEAADVIERTPSAAHVVLDEAQDLSAMMLRAVGRRCTTGSMTVLGDLAQATTPWGVGSWQSALAHLGKPAAQRAELTVGFRVPADVLAFAAALLPVVAPELAPPRSLRRARGDMVVSAVDDVLAAATVHVQRAARRAGSVALIVPDEDAGRHAVALRAGGVDFVVMGDERDAEVRTHLVPAALAKGLEFDHVVVAEPADIVGAVRERLTGLRLLYVCLTRAVTSLAVVHSKPLPEPLSGAR